MQAARSLGRFFFCITPQLEAVTSPRGCRACWNRPQAVVQCGSLVLLVGRKVRLTVFLRSTTLLIEFETKWTKARRVVESTLCR